MGQLIVKSRIEANLAPLNNTELAVSISAWGEILLGEVPENYLERSYIRAMRDKESSYALTASGLVQGYRAVCESERAAPRVAQNANLLSGEVCGKCHGSGMELYNEGGYMQARRCDHVVEVIEADPDDVSMF